MTSMLIRIVSINSEMNTSLVCYLHADLIGECKRTG